jgi:hypothetical protein
MSIFTRKSRKYGLKKSLIDLRTTAPSTAWGCGYGGSLGTATVLKRYQGKEGTLSGGELFEAEDLVAFRVEMGEDDGLTDGNGHPFLVAFNQCSNFAFFTFVDGNHIGIFVFKSMVELRMTV